MGAPFVYGGLNVVFSTAPTRAWDLAIDQVQLKIQCDALASDVTYDVRTGTGGTFSGLVDYLSLAPKSCATVPVPTSAALVLAGVLGLGLSLRRKA